MNDICESSKILSFILFSDDTNLFFSNNFVCLYNSMNQELKEITLWLSANKLSLNLSKTHFMVFRSKNRKMLNDMLITINGKTIEKVKNTKFLGLYVDDELSWKFHINQIATKI